MTWPDHYGSSSVGQLGYGIETVAAGRSEVLTRQDGTTVRLVYDLAGRTEDREYREFGVALTSAATDTDTMAYDADSKLIEGAKGRYGNTLAFA